MNKLLLRLSTVTLLFAVLCIGQALAIRNICNDCGQVAEPTDITCSKCDEPLNICLACDTMNEVQADFCAKCGEDLAYMRVLSTIDPETRDELRLGQSDRARLERSLARLNHLLEKDPENAETYLYRRAKVYQQMGFWSNEANAWSDFLRQFPDTPKKNRIQGFQSEALRKWGFLFYQQGQKQTAQEKFLQAVKVNPMNTEAWLWAGRCAMESDQKAEAAEYYLSGLKSDPGNKTALHFLRQLKKSVPKELSVAPKPAQTSPAKSGSAPKSEPKAAPTVQDSQAATVPNTLSEPAKEASATGKTGRVNPEAGSQMPPIKEKGK